MATFQCDIGAQGQGKSLRQAVLIYVIFERNKKWYEKTKIVRPIACNFPLNLENFSKEDRDRFFLPMWNDVKELCKLRNCDVFWDEVANDLDARNFAMLSAEVKRLLSRADKRGLEIFCNTQDFDMVDKRARRMFSAVFQVTKLLGTPRPSATRPKIEKPWGLYWCREFENYKDEGAVMDPAKREFAWIPQDVWTLEDRYLKLYDTLFESGAKNYPPLEHVEQICEIHGNGCSFRKTSHL